MYLTLPYPMNCSTYELHILWIAVYSWISNSLLWWFVFIPKQIQEPIHCVSFFMFWFWQDWNLEKNLHTCYESTYCSASSHVMSHGYGFMLHHITAQTHLSVIASRYCKTIWVPQQKDFYFSSHLFLNCDETLSTDTLLFSLTSANQTIVSRCVDL